MVPNAEQLTDTDALPMSIKVMITLFTAIQKKLILLFSGLKIISL